MFYWPKKNNPQRFDDILGESAKHVRTHWLRCVAWFLLFVSFAYLPQAVAQTSSTCPSVTVGEQSGFLISPSLYSGCYYSVSVQHRAQQKTPIIEYLSLANRYYGAYAQGSATLLYDDFTPAIVIGSRQLVEHVTTDSGFSQVPMIVNMGSTEPSSCANKDYTAAAESVIKVTGNWYCAKEASVSAVSVYYKWQAGSVPFESSEISYVETGGAGISVSTASISVAEGSTATTLSSTTATFMIVLDSEPTANVTIGLSSSNTNKGIVSPSSLTFTSSNWNTARTVTVTSVDDAVADGDYNFSIVTASAISTDSFYNDLNSSDVSVTNIDDDNVGITVGDISGDTTEAGGTATFTVKLNSEPTAEVSIVLNSGDTGEGTVGSAMLTFTPANWNGVQTVTVTGVDDEAADGNQSFDIVTEAATSTDSDYDGVDAVDVSVTNIDNDSAAIIEASVPNATGAGFGDGNGDGTADSDQGFVTSLKSNDGNHWLTFTNTTNASQANFSTGAVPTTLPADNQLTLGTVQFDIASSSGAILSIEVYVDQDTAISDYLLLGNDGEWYAQNAAVTHSGNKTKLVFSVTEGGNFDRNAADDGILPDGTLQLAQGGVMVKTGLAVYPYAHLFGNVDLNTQTAAKTFTLSNTGSRVLALTTISFAGNDAAEFTIDSNTCANQTLSAGETCQVAVRFRPTSIGSKTAQLSIQTDDPDNATMNIFLRNHEADEEESARRLPPVLNSFSIEDASGQVVSTMQVGTSYTFKWSILGYHEDYNSLLAIFDCRGITDNTTCGDSYLGTKFLATGSIDDDGAPVEGHWRNGSVQSRVFSFSYTFVTPALTEEAPVVIRFYRKNADDQQAGNRSLSLIIPGNQAEDYYDTTGRRVKNTISLQ